MDEPARRFYTSVFTTALLNAYAVKYGYFDALLCNTEDPRVARRWQEAAPKIAEQLAGIVKNPGEPPF